MHKFNKFFLKLTVCAYLILNINFSNAQAVFVCTSEEGVIEYTNNNGKNCKELKLQKLNIIPSPSYKPNAPNQAFKPFNNSSKSNVQQPLPAFPTISQNVQSQRDNDRRSILGKELDDELKKLQELQKEFNAGTPERKGDEKNYQKYLDRVEQLKKNISRAQGNIESLKKELGLK